MILKDIAGRLIFPAHILGLEVVAVDNTPARYADKMPERAAHAVCVKLFAPYVDEYTYGLHLYPTTQYAVLAWFDRISPAEEALSNLVAALTLHDQDDILEGRLEL
jgi:hypothetical protein